jgi:hypothetical protein
VLLSFLQADREIMAVATIAVDNNVVFIFDYFLVSEVYQRVCFFVTPCFQHFFEKVVSA